MMNTSDIKTGKHIVWEGQAYTVLYHEHSKTGRAGAVLRTKLKNLFTGNVLDKTFQGSEKVEEAEVTKSKAQYLYREGEGFAFLDMESYDQFVLSQETIGNGKDYLLEGTEVTVLNFNGAPIAIELPAKATLLVTDAPPGIKGDTVSGAEKLITLETGLQVSAPLFVKEGDRVIVNTERGTYVSRA